MIAGLTVLDRLVQVVSIAIVVVAGVFVLALVPYVQGREQFTLSQPARTATPVARREAVSQPVGAALDDAGVEAAFEDAALPASEPAAVPASEPAAEPVSEPAAEPTAVPDTRALPIEAKAQSASSGALPTFAPTESAEPVEGLVLAPMSQFARDYELKALIYPDGGMRIPALIQHDYKTPVATLNGRNISVWTSGCGADVISMVVSGLAGRNDQTPYTLFRWAAERGLYKGSGLEHDALTQMASLYGVRGRWIEPDAEAILEALNAGCPVVAHMGKGVFTANGHYILLRGVAPDGTIYVNDPAELEHCYATYPLDQIIAESKSDDPFMICSAPETAVQSQG